MKYFSKLLYFLSLYVRSFLRWFVVFVCQMVLCYPVWILILHFRLTSSFINKLHQTEKRFEMNAQLFKSDFREKISTKVEHEKGLSMQSNKLREWTYSKFQERIDKCPWNQNRLAPILPFVHGTDYGMNLMQMWVDRSNSEDFSTWVAIGVIFWM